MSFVQVTINEEIMCDGEFSELTVRLPDFLNDIVEKMQPHSAQQPESHLICVMGAFAEAVARRVVSITIDVSTGPDWWTMTVKER